MTKRIAVIGCGAAGATAALQARKYSRDVSIAVFNTEVYSQYSRCGLPYTISGKVREYEDLVLMPPKNWNPLKIEAKLGTNVNHIDHSAHVLSYDGESEDKELEYDALVFATGAENKDPPIKGLDKDRVYGLRTIDDAKALSVEVENAKKAAVIGGGLVGMETAEAFYERGLDVTVVEFLPNIMLTMVDPDMAEIVEDHCREHGIKILTNTAAQEIVGEKRPSSIVVKDRVTEETQSIDADFIVVATGIRPVTGLAEEIGVKIGPTGGIVTDDRMMTNIDDVYACGDCAEHKDFVTRTPSPGGLGTIAVRQGRVAGINAAGGDARFVGIVGAKVTKLFGLEIATTGLTGDMAARLNVPVVKGSLKGSTKPPYYVGGKDLKVKAYFNKETGKLVGGQLVGLEDAAMRLNVLTIGIQNDVDASELFDFENCYAPAICDTWDPLVEAASAAKRRLKKKSR